MFTKRHMISVAATLALSRKDCVSVDAGIAVDNTVQVFADTFAAVNPNFDRAKFTAAYEQMVANCMNGNSNTVRGYARQIKAVTG